MRGSAGQPMEILNTMESQMPVTVATHTFETVFGKCGKPAGEKTEPFVNHFGKPILIESTSTRSSNRRKARVVDRHSRGGSHATEPLLGNFCSPSDLPVSSLGPVLR